MLTCCFPHLLVVNKFVCFDWVKLIEADLKMIEADSDWLKLIEKNTESRSKWIESLWGSGGKPIEIAKNWLQRFRMEAGAKKTPWNASVCNLVNAKRGGGGQKRGGAAKLHEETLHKKQFPTPSPQCVLPPPPPPPCSTISLLRNTLNFPQRTSWETACRGSPTLVSNAPSSRGFDFRCVLRRAKCIEHASKKIRPSTRWPVMRMPG